ncbi:MAG: DUF2283 domain-containing protein [Chloroflexi bacterium]|nr:DUF2283 domain-containing protein [Chloroflexota bacterium]
MTKPYVHYYEDTDSLFLVFSDNHDQTVSEEVADNVIAIFNEADNRLVAIEILNGAGELFKGLISKLSKPSKAKAARSA